MNYLITDELLINELYNYLFINNGSININIKHLKEVDLIDIINNENITIFIKNRNISKNFCKKFNIKSEDIYNNSFCFEIYISDISNYSINELSSINYNYNFIIIYTVGKDLLFYEIELSYDKEGGSL